MTVWKGGSLPQEEILDWQKGGQRMEHQNLKELLRQGCQGNVEMVRELGVGGCVYQQQRSQKPKLSSKEGVPTVP